MKLRIMIALAFGLALAAGAGAENYFLSVSATTTSTTKLLPKYANGVLLCNDSGSANIAYVRLFSSIDVASGSAASATSAPAVNTNSSIAIGVCKSWGPSADGAPWAAVSILSAGTSTVTIDTN